jgi:hypothetical protein
MESQEPGEAGSSDTRVPPLRSVEKWDSLEKNLAHCRADPKTLEYFLEISRNDS